MFVLQNDVGARDGPKDDNADDEEGSQRARTEDEESRHGAE